MRTWASSTIAPGFLRVKRPEGHADDSPSSSAAGTTPRPPVSSCDLYLYRYQNWRLQNLHSVLHDQLNHCSVPGRGNRPISSPQRPEPDVGPTQRVPVGKATGTWSWRQPQYDAVVKIRLVAYPHRDGILLGAQADRQGRAQWQERLMHTRGWVPVRTGSDMVLMFWEAVTIGRQDASDFGRLRPRAVSSISCLQSKWRHCSGDVAMLLFEACTMSLYLGRTWTATLRWDLILRRHWGPWPVGFDIVQSGRC